MRKWLIVLIAVLGLSGVSHAQDFTIRFGPSFTLAPDFGFGLEAELNATKIAQIDSGISLGLNGNLGLGFPGGTVRFGLQLGPTINFDLNRGRGNVFAGLGLGVFGGGGGGAAFAFGFLAGIDYRVSTPINLFGRLNLLVVPGFSAGLDLGADFSLSRAIALYGKLSVGFSGTFGLGLGLTFKL